MDELDKRVTRNREEIDARRQRLAELQAVIDRIRVVATNARQTLESPRE